MCVFHQCQYAQPKRNVIQLMEIDSEQRRIGKHLHRSTDVIIHMVSNEICLMNSDEHFLITFHHLNQYNVVFSSFLLSFLNKNN